MIIPPGGAQRTGTIAILLQLIQNFCKTIPIQSNPIISTVRPAFYREFDFSKKRQFSTKVLFSWKKCKKGKKSHLSPRQEKQNCFFLSVLGGKKTHFS
jgi:hypothetical protein